ncbi:MAG: GvpL/GvpF family gas vesicle protein [Methanotrichaceae archaeon]
MTRQILRSRQQAQNERGWYVYCVINSPAEKISFGKLGFEGEEVYTMDYRSLSPVISDVAFREYAVSEEDVEVHKRVLGHVMQEYSVLPVAYGMAFKNRRLLQLAMSAGYTAMKKAFTVIDGKVELGIKVILPKDAEGWDEARRRDFRSDFILSLKDCAADSKELKLFSDRMILNSAFLVERSGVERFSEQVGELSSRYGELMVQYSGPWPAYNFVDIHILGRKRKGFR